MIGALPPPVHGQILEMQKLLESEHLSGRFELIHVDISDHRDLDQVGRVDPTNVVLGIVHLWRLALTLLRRRPDLVHLDLAQYAPGIWRDAAFIWTARLLGTPVCGRMSGGGMGEYIAARPWPLRQILVATLRRLRLLLLAAESDTERLERTVGELPWAYVGAGVEPRADVERSYEDPMRVIYPTSSVRPSKGSDIVRGAIELLAADGLPLRWSIVGERRDAAEWRRFKELAGRVEGIELIGPLPHAKLLDAYEAADLMVFPSSRIEGMAAVRLEAMAAGLPVITTPAGGAAELARDGREGLIIPHNDPGALAASVRRLAAERRRLAEMGEAARERQRLLFTRTAFHERYADAWEQALAAEPQRASAE